MQSNECDSSLQWRGFGLGLGEKNDYGGNRGEIDDQISADDHDFER